MSTAAPELGTGPRRVLTFRPRRGRVTPRQQRALDASWAGIGLDVGSEVGTGRLLDLDALFGRTAGRVLEIGFGMGEATVAMAAADPGTDVLAVDVHTPGVGALLAGIAENELTNVRVAQGDGVELLERLLAPASLDGIRVFFPDPWPKERHRKRRLVQPGFVALAASRLRPGGGLHLATDWTPYAQQMLSVVAGEPALRNLHQGYAPRPAGRPVTRFERQGLAKGHRVHDILCVRG